MTPSFCELCYLLLPPAWFVACANCCCRLWKGFLASKLSSAELLLFALFTFAVAPNGLRFQLVKHLVTDPSGAHMLQAYLGQEDS